MNATTKIMNKLDEIFAPLDAEVLKASQQWAKERKQAVYDFQGSDEYASLRGDHFRRYQRIIEIAGGKTWYNIFDGRNFEMVEEYMVKHCANVAKARNLKITGKLQKSGITDVLSEEISFTDDGFNGTFVINTDDGQKQVKINTIYAGGYHIQCAHLRVLVKIK